VAAARRPMTRIGALNQNNCWSMRGFKCALHI
jgi:hypothetical protein